MMESASQRALYFSDIIKKNTAKLNFVLWYSLLIIELSTTYLYFNNIFLVFGSRELSLLTPSLATPGKSTKSSSYMHPFNYVFHSFPRCPNCEAHCLSILLSPRSTCIDLCAMYTNSINQQPISFITQLLMVEMSVNYLYLLIFPRFFVREKTLF